MIPDHGNKSVPVEALTRALEKTKETFADRCACILGRARACGSFRSDPFDPNVVCGCRCHGGGKGKR